MSLEELAFAGNERFRIQRRLGGGGFGVVYQAFDQEHHSVVALKTLRPGNQEALYRLKREFRTLADITHPNLVRLYELLSEDDQWFFTMELVEGSSFLEYVRGRSAGEVFPFSRARDLERYEDMDTKSLSETAQAAASRRRQSGGVVSACPDFERLRGALRQTAAGISAIHAARRLHRDIKSSNVLVSRERRVVLLDFGLAFDLTHSEADSSSLPAGTPGYMSPEQCLGRGVAEPSDWYSLGVMMFEALTGQSPFHGSFFEMFEQKRRGRFAFPQELVAEVPADLERLCRDLLLPDPRSRPTGEEVLRRLGGEPAAAVPRVSRAAVTGDSTPLVGREEHLGILRDAFREVVEGRPVSVFVHGSSGMGKTALVRHFLSEFRAADDIVVLSGRCYEREAVPYKALDSLVDALSQHLRHLSVEQAEAILPRDVLALARLFPVLRRVDAVTRARRFVLEIPDVHELRRRAFAAFRDLVGRLAERKSVILFIDDLHWGDLDSATLLSELLRPPEAPPLLLIGTYRTEDVDTSPFLRMFLPDHSSAAESREVVVGELSSEDARRLAEALLGESPPAATSAAAIARESGGNPFWIDELAHHARTGAAQLAPSSGEEATIGSGEATLDRVIQARLSGFSEQACRFLEIVAVAGRPLEVSVAQDAASVEAGDDVLVELRAARLIRTRGAENGSQVETYHDRIRDAVVGRLSVEETRSHHRRLALALEATGRGDPEELTFHFREAGEPARGAEYAPAAAARAAEALAFDRAARLYLLALELYPGGEDETRRALRVKLGDALANAGRGLEAASSYLAAIRGARAAEALELQRRAAEQLLRSGHLDVALPVLREVLSRVGLRLVEAPLAALFHFLVRRLLIRLRGLRFRERDATQVSAQELMRIDACWSASIGLSMVDTIRGKDFQARHLLLALKAGEPYRIARAVANEAGYSATPGRRAARRTQELVERALTLADRVGHPQALGVAQVAVGVTAYLQGRWKEAWSLAQTGEAILRERCTGVAWELDTTHIYSLRALYYLGEIAELSARLPVLLKEARERDDLFAATSLLTRHNYIARLCDDDPGRAREELDEAIDGWSSQGFHLQHFFALVAEAEIALYQGNPEAAWNLLQERWSSLRGSRLLRVQVFRVEAWFARARAALSLAAAERDPGRVTRWLALARRDARRIEREKAPWAYPLAKLLRAGIETMAGRRVAATELLASAARDFGAADMAQHAWVASQRLETLLAVAEQSAREEPWRQWAFVQRVRNPEGIARMIAPGRW